MRRTTLLALAVAATVLVVPASAAGCANVTRSGHWSIVETQGVVDPSTLEVAFGRSGKDTMYAIDNTHRSVQRSRDGGCTWAPVLSLDTAGATTDVFRYDLDFAIMSIAVAQSGSARPRMLYVIASEDGDTVGPATPLVTFASADDGAHWTVHQAATADLLTDYPRCARDGLGGSRPRIGADPSTLYLRCRAANLAEAFLLTQCQVAYYLSHDGGATWTPIHGRYRDLANAAGDPNLGCVTVGDPVPSGVTPHEVWDIAVGDANHQTRVLLSHDDGRTFTTYAHHAVADGCLCGYLARPEPGSKRPLVATWDGTSVYLPDAAGVLRAVPSPKPPVGSIVSLVGVAPVPDARGRDRLLAAYALEKPGGAAVFLLDPATHRWSSFETPGKRADKSPAWSTGSMREVTAPGVPTVYFVTWDLRIVRYVR